MKRLTVYLMALVLCLSLCACGGGNNTPTSNVDDTPSATEDPVEETPTASTLALGETASSDLAEFTLENSQFTYYVSNVSTNLAEPTEEPNEMFAASIGHCYVSLTFTITNKDRGGSICYAGSFAEWEPKWTVSYGGTDYPVKGFDLNKNAGYNSINLSFSAVIDKESGDTIGTHNLNSYLLDAGETVTLRTFGIIDVDPENLTDAYDLAVGVLNSKGWYDYFTYTVPTR